MRLLIDIGNSRLKWCSYSSGGKPGHSHAIRHNNCLTEQQLDQCWSGIEQPEAVFMVSVADSSIGATVKNWISDKWSVCAVELTTTPRCANVINGYRVPEQLGVDRWAAIIGAYKLTRQAVCVIDSGTALTCDAVDSNGKHLGGVITPGRDLQQQVLLHGTAGITITDENSGYDWWGRDTSTCITSGIVQSQLGLIEHFVRQAQNFLATKVSVVITGGDAEVLMPYLPRNSRLVPDLVFLGMTYMMMEQGG